MIRLASHGQTQSEELTYDEGGHFFINHSEPFVNYKIKYQTKEGHPIVYYIDPIADKKKENERNDEEK